MNHSVPVPTALALYHRALMLTHQGGPVGGGERAHES
jgi:hypothetical protein